MVGGVKRYEIGRFRSNTEKSYRFHIRLCQMGEQFTHMYTNLGPHTGVKNGQPYRDQL